MAGNPLYHQAMRLVEQGNNHEALELLAPEPELQERLRTRYIPHTLRMFQQQDAKFCSEVTALACNGEPTRALELLSHRPHPDCDPRWEPNLRQNIVEGNYHDWTVDEVLARGFLYVTNVNADRRHRLHHWTLDDWARFDVGFKNLELEHLRKIEEQLVAHRAEQDRRTQILKAGTYLQKHLLARGWTRTLITRLLGDPDVKCSCTSGNGSHRHDYDEHHYSKARVLEAEQGAEFRKWVERRALAPLRKLAKARLANSRALATNIKNHSVHPLPPIPSRVDRILAGGAQPDPSTKKTRIRRKHSPPNRYERKAVI